MKEGAIIDKPGSSVKNKTGGWRSKQPILDKKKCIGCGNCWKFCPAGAIKKTKDGKFEIDYDMCKGCGICAKECPVKAIKMVKEEK